MVMGMKTKIYVVVTALIMQFGMHAMTENRLRVSTLVAGLAAGLVVSKSENPALIGAVSLCSAGLAYNYLKKFTAAFKLNIMNSEFDIVKAAGYGNCWIPEGDEIKPFNKEQFSPEKLKPIPGQEYENFITLIETRSYGNGEHSLAVAYQEIESFYPIFKRAAPLLTAIKGNAEADGLSDQWHKTNNRCTNYFNDLTKADLWIKKYPTFAQQNTDYKQSKNNTEQLAINQQAADAKMIAAAAAIKKAEAARIAAQAQKKESDAVSSWLNAKWWNLVWNLFFRRNN